MKKPVYAGYVEAPKWGVSLRKGQHEGLISFETFEKIQKKMKDGGYVAEKMTGMLEHHIDEQLAMFSRAGEALDVQRQALVKRQRIERVRLVTKQQARQVTENKQRFARLPRGLKGIWQRITGNYSKLIRQNEHEAEQCKNRDCQESQGIVERHLDERRNLQRQIRQVRVQYHTNIDELHKGINTYLDMSNDDLKTTLGQRIEQQQHRLPSIGLRI